jgi:NAD(P)-dependent dehydrogenase (short-subunit alcohol dehydrogenase family)
MPVAVITGASQGLGLALATHLAAAGWSLVVDARDAARLEAAADGLPGGPHVAVPGDVTDSWHRGALAATATELGGADLLVNNASTLGASPLPALADLEPATYSRILEVNVVAPMALTALLLPQLRERGGRIVNITSDASVEAYETWGGYGSAKAALDHATRVLAAEEPDLKVYAVDPGDLRTAMHQAAFPGEDIGDRPEPATVVPRLLRLVTGDLPSGRHRAADLEPVVEVRT